MSKRTNLFRYSLGLSFLLFSHFFITLACGPSSNGFCKRDTDCPGTKECLKGVCRSSQAQKELQREKNKEGLKEESLDATSPPETKLETALPEKPKEQTAEETPEPAQDLDPSTCRNDTTKSCYSGASKTKEKGSCKAGKQKCIGGFWSAECVGEVLPQPENCDGTDNDCNGQIDDLDPKKKDQPCQIKNLKGPCAAGKNICKKGKLICTSSFKKEPKEICDNKIDDDCDGLPDGPPCKCRSGETRECSDSGKGNIGACRSGKQTCKSGAWGTCAGEKKPKPESCDGIDNNCDGQIDESDSALGKSCTNSGEKGLCQQGKLKCSGGKLTCNSSYSPASEICGNGKDENCDGQADEGCQCKPKTSRACYTGSSGTPKAPCKKGTQVCLASGKWEAACKGQILPKTETCDNKDNNCDGNIDENVKKACTSKCGKGFQVCKAGKYLACNAPNPTTEVCNNKDDDCDGSIDETLSQSCSNSCGKGIETCKSGKWIGCSAPLPKKEICDGIDNDCDSKIDEGCECVHKKTESCYSGPAGQDKKPCKRGSRACSFGKWGPCIGQILPSKEVCDGIDNDCDGKIDDALNCQCANGKIQQCYTAKSGCTKLSNGTYTCKPPCRAGSQKCISGKWTTCTKQYLPRTEYCNTKDDDCDGKIDESDPYLGIACSTGQKGICAIGTYKCISGKRTCVPSYKKTTEICDGKDNDCDGYTDESDYRIGKNCIVPKRFGNCRIGKNACSLGKLYCQQYIHPTTESCRIRGKDEDCDGRTDEICGSLHQYIIASSSGKATKARGFMSQRVGVGTYRLSAFATKSATTCSNGVLFPLPTTSSMRPTSYYCYGSRFDVRIGSSGTRTNKTYDWSFQAVTPTHPGNDGAYGLVSGRSCSKTSQVCPQSRNRAYSKKAAYTTVVTRINIGQYKIKHPNCLSGVQPILLSIYSKIIDGYATAYFNSKGYCYVRTFDLYGKLADRTFAYWLPDPTTTAWAYISSAGSVNTSNYFKDLKARWTARKGKTTILTNHFYEVDFPSWAYSSAVLTSARGYSAMIVPTTIKKGSGVIAYPYKVSAGKKTANYFHILFIQ